MSPSSSARRPRGRVRCGLESPTWATASSYSLLASGLTGPSCSPPPSEAARCGRRARRGARRRAAPRAAGRPRSRAAQLSPRAPSAPPPRRRATCWARTSAPVTASFARRHPALELHLLAGASAQLRRRPLAHLLVGFERGGKLLAPGGHRVARRLECRDGAPGRALNLAVVRDTSTEAHYARAALRALALDLLEHAALGAKLRGELGVPDGRRPLVGRAAAALDQPVRAAHLLGRPPPPAGPRSEGRPRPKSRAANAACTASRARSTPLWAAVSSPRRPPRTPL